MKTSFTYEPLTPQEQQQVNVLYDNYYNGGSVFNNEQYQAAREAMARANAEDVTNTIRDTIGFRNGMDPAVSHSKNYLTSDGKLGASASSSSSAKANYIKASDALESAKNALGYVTDPMQEQQARKELQMAQIAYDVAKKEFTASKMQDENLITEEQASGKEPVTPRNGRTYEGTGQKAQNPEKLGEKEKVPTLDDLKNLSQISLQQGAPKIGEQELVPGRANQAGYRAANTVTGAVKGFAGDTVNSAATAAAGLSALGKKLGGDTGEYAGWATDEVSRAAIPLEQDSKKYEQQMKEATDMQAVSDRLAQNSAEDIAQAKQGLGFAGRLAVDIGSNAIQMAGDGLAAVLTGGAINPLTSMFARSSGGAARQARNDGASIAQQVIYGTVRGGIEVATEKMFDGLAGLYGAGEADKIVEKVIGKMADSDTGRTALRVLFSGLGEAAEEGVSGFTDHFTDAIYKGIGSIPKSFTTEHAAETIYSMLVGFAMGAAGGGTKIVNGSNAEANAALREAEAQQAQPITHVTETPKNGRTYDGVGQKAQNPERAAEIAAQQQNAQPVNPITDIPKNGRTYEGTGNKAQNPEKAAAQAQTVDFAQQKANAEAKLAQAQAAYESASNDPEMQPILLQQVEQAQQELDEANAKLQAETPKTPSGHSTTSHTSESASTPESQGDTQNGETWSGPEVQTQSTVHDQLTEEEKARDDLNPENDTHIQHHDEEVDSFAQNRITERGHENAREDLMSRDPAEWDDVDVRTAQMLLTEELENARQLTGEEQDAAYKRIAELKNAYNKQGTEAGRSLRQRQRFGGTETDIITEAAAVLYGEESQKNLRNMSPEEKSDLMKTIEDYAHRRETRQAGDTASLIDMIKDLNGKRHTAGLFTDKTSRIMSWFLELTAKQEGGEAFLNDILGQQIRGLANDQVKATKADIVDTIRFQNMLSNVATIIRNFIANPAMGLSEAISADLGLLTDIALSKFTGTRSVPFDSSIFSKEKWKGSTEAFIRSVIEEGLDAPLGTTGKYEEVRQGRTFKMSNGFMERVLSTWTKYLNYGLKSTDELAKGGHRATTQAGIDRLHDAGKISDKGYAELKDRADYVAKERTLQKDDGAAGAVTKARNDLGFFGKLVMPFAQVPVNATAMAVNYTAPAGYLSTLYEIGKAALNVKKGGTFTADQQAKIVTSIGRNLNATALVGLSFMLAMKGIIRTSQEEDKDKAALEKSEGLSGTQFNLSALGRFLSGDKSEEQPLKADDNLIGLGYLEYLNASMALGAALAEDYKENGKITAKDIAMDNLTAVWDSVMSLPAISQLSSFADNLRYSEADTTGGKLADATTGFVGSTASSYLVPNALRGIAKGLDENERVTYTGDSLENSINYLKAGVPGLRETLPVKVDPLGNEVNRGDNPLVNFLNATVMPGELKTYTPHEVTSELTRISEATGTSVYPDRNAPNKISYGKESYELTADEKTEYLKYEGKKTEEYLESLFKTPYYQQMSDELKAEAIKEMESLAKDAAKQNYLAGKGVDYSSNTTNLLLGSNKPGTTYDRVALNQSNLVTYTAFKLGLDDAIKNGDYTAIDYYVSQYNKMSKNLKTVAGERIDELEKLAEYRANGMDAATYYEVKSSRSQAQYDLDENASTSAAVRLLGLSYADIPESEKAKIVNNIEDYIGSNGKAAYNALTKYGINTYGAYDFFNTALNCKTWKDTGQPVDSNGKLSADATAYALSVTPGLTDEQRVAIFNEIKGDVSNRYNDWGNYTYPSEIAYINRSSNKATYSKPMGYITENNQPSNPLDNVTRFQSPKVTNALDAILGLG